MTTDIGSAIDKIAQAMCQPNVITLFPSPELDDVDSFLITMGHYLRKLTISKRTQIMQQFLKVTYDALPENEKQ